MNNVNIIGRMTADPELRHTQSGTACTRFTIAVDRRVKQGEEKQTDFITIVAWQQRAEFICKYFSKDSVYILFSASSNDTVGSASTDLNTEAQT